MKLKYRLSLTVILILVTVITTLSIILVNRTTAIQMATALKSQERLAAELAEDIKAEYEEHLKRLETIAGMMADYEISESGEQRVHLGDMLLPVIQANEDLAAIYTVFKPNTVDAEYQDLFAGSPGSTDSGQYADYYLRGSEQIEHLTYNDVDTVMSLINGADARQAVIYNPTPETVAGKETFIVNISCPIIHRTNNEVVGRVGAKVNTAYTQAEGELIIQSNREVAALSVYSHNGTILAGGVPEQLGKTLLSAQAVLFGNDAQEAHNAVLTGTKRRYQKHSAVLDKDVEVILYPFSLEEFDVSWTIMVGSEAAVILSQIKQLTIFTIVIVIVVTIFAVVLIFLTSFTITKPIGKVAESLQYLSQGDFTHYLDIRSKDEIGDLALDFNIMVEKVKRLIATIKNNSTTLFNTGQELSSNMNETAAAVNEINANIQSISGLVINQSASITETNATMQQITLHINKLSTHIDNQDNSVSRSSSAVEGMLANVHAVTETLLNNAESMKELKEASEGGRIGIEGVSEDIKEIAHESAGLLEINAVIVNIASQTNLLSMNASIEAAHAGETGKGFSVVAEEIRKLAESCSEQSNTIAEVLKKIKDSIDNIVRSTESVLTKFEAIENGVIVVSDQAETIRGAMEEQGIGSKQILQAIEKVNEATQVVKSGSEEMLEGSKQVIQESKNLEMATQEITNGMNEMVRGATEINRSVLRVNEIAYKNKENIDELTQEIAKFKVE